MEQDTVKGEITGISHEKQGVKIGTKWYDYEAHVEKYLRKGDKVEATLKKGKVSFVKREGNGAKGSAPRQAAAPENDRENYWKEKSKQDKIKDAQVRREACINSANATLKMAAEHKMFIDHKEEKSADGRVIALAKKYEKFVMGDEDRVEWNKDPA